MQVRIYWGYGKNIRTFNVGKESDTGVDSSSDVHTLNSVLHHKTKKMDQTVQSSVLEIFQSV